MLSGKTATPTEAVTPITRLPSSHTALQIASARACALWTVALAAPA